MINFKSGLFWTMLACSGMLLAENDFGPLAEARERFPQYFVSGAVGEAKTVNGVEVYYYNGVAEQFFTGDLAESDSELWLEAELDAKSKLYHFFQGDDESVVVNVQLQEARLAYRWKEGKIYRSLYVVDKSKLLVEKTRIAVLVEPPLVPAEPLECKNLKEEDAQEVTPQQALEEEPEVVKAPEESLQNEEPPSALPLEEVAPPQENIPEEDKENQLEPPNAPQLLESEGELSPFNPPVLVLPPIKK